MNQEVIQNNSTVAQTTVFRNVYKFMAAALLLTGLTAMVVFSSEPLFKMLYSSMLPFWIIVIAQLGLVFYISSRIMKLSLRNALGLFLLYSVLNGVMLSVIFAVYTTTSIATTFFVTAATFGAMSLYGYVTKKDLSSWGSVLFMLLIGLIIASVVNIFWANSTMYWIITYAGVLIFVGLTAYDTQKIKRMLSGAEDNETYNKFAVLGALTLYLDFINLFLYLLRLLGNRK